MNSGIFRTAITNVRFTRSVTISKKLLDVSKPNRSFYLYSFLRNTETLGDVKKDKIDSVSSKNSAHTSENAEDDLNRPIQFSTSRASKWTAAETHFMQPNDTPWFQVPCVIIPVACLLLWFGIFREENDIDEEMGKTLWERVPGLELTNIKSLIKYNKQKGLPTEDLERRLKELEDAERK